MATLPILRTAVAGTRSLAPERTIVDLRHLTFIDVPAIRLLLELCGADPHLQVWPGIPEVQRVFALTGTHVRLFGVPHALLRGEG